MHALYSYFCIGYLVRMINTVLWDMRVFLFILFIIYFSFGEAFLRISEASTPESSFIINYGHALVYTFRLSLGDTSTDTFNDVEQYGTVWIIFVLCSLYTEVMMLNLLIAIIS